MHMDMANDLFSGVGFVNHDGMRGCRFRFGLKAIFAITTQIALLIGGRNVWTYDGFVCGIAAVLHLALFATIVIWSVCRLDDVPAEDGSLVQQDGPIH